MAGLFLAGLFDFGTDFEAFLSFFSTFLGETDFISTSALGATTAAGAVKNVLTGWVETVAAYGFAKEELLLVSLRRDLPLDSSSTTASFFCGFSTFTFSTFSAFLVSATTTGLDLAATSIFLAGLEDRPRLGFVVSGFAATGCLVLAGDFETLGAGFTAGLFV